MCIGAPVQVVETGEFMAVCRGRNGEELVNTLLIGPQPQGAWLLNFLGSARQILSAEEALQINQALDGLSAIMAGAKEIDVDHYFPGLRGSIAS